MQQLRNLANTHYENNMSFQLLDNYSGKGEEEFKLFTGIFLKLMYLRFFLLFSWFPISSKGLE